MQIKLTQSFRSAVVGAVLVALSGGAQAADVHVLNWQGYGTDEKWAVAEFESRTGHTVVHDYFNSEAEMLTKLRTNPGTYDVVLINSAYTQQAVDEGLIQAIDVTGMRNVPDLDPGLRNNRQLAFDGATYGVAWVWGVTSIAIDEEAVRPAPNSIAVLWDPEYAGRVGWRDDAVEAVQFAALATGQSINDVQDLDAVREKLLALAPQIRTFWSSEAEWNQFFTADEFDIAPYWSGSALRSRTEFNLPVQFVIPEEGAIGWLDGLSIATDAPNPAGAKAFIDWMIDPEFYVKWDTEVGAPVSANSVAVSRLPDGNFNRDVLAGQNTLERLEIMAPLDEARRREYLAIWEEVKAAMN